MIPQILTLIVFIFISTGLASVRPEPQNKEDFIKSQTYDLTYPAAIPNVYAWPKL